MCVVCVVCVRACGTNYYNLETQIKYGALPEKTDKGTCWAEALYTVPQLISSYQSSLQVGRGFPSTREGRGSITGCQVELLSPSSRVPARVEVIDEDEAVRGLHCVCVCVCVWWWIAV